MSFYNLQESLLLFPFTLHLKAAGEIETDLISKDSEFLCATVSDYVGVRPS